MNNLFNDVNATIAPGFTGYIGGRQTTVRGTGQAGEGITAIIHSYGNFQGPIDNTAGTAPINIDLGAASTGTPHRIIAVGGEGTINMRGGDLALLSSRTGQNGNNGFTITEARSVRIGAETLDNLGLQNGQQVWRDERGSVYRINPEAQVTRVARDRANFEDTRDDVAGQTGANFIRQGGQLPHATNVNVAGQPPLDLAELLPFRPEEAPTAVAQNQPTLRAGQPTATGIGATPIAPANAATRLFNGVTA